MSTVSLFISKTALQKHNHTMPSHWSAKDYLKNIVEPTGQDFPI